MQTFNIDTGKTRAELAELTEITNLGAVTYDPSKKIVYENDWHTITPNAVIKPEIDGKELDYYYNKTKLTKSAKYCAQLYWKAGLSINDGNSSDLVNDTRWLDVNNTAFRSGGIFNIESGLVDNSFYTYGTYYSAGDYTFYYKNFAISEELAQILDTTEIRETIEKLPTLQRAVPTSGSNYLYNGTQAYTSSRDAVGFNITTDTGLFDSPNSNIFGHYAPGNYKKSPDFTISNGSKNDNSGETVQFSYQQAENNNELETFYNFAAGIMSTDTPDYIKTYYPQALPIGVPIVISPMHLTVGTTKDTSSDTVPFIFYMLGITETPTEA